MALRDQLTLAVLSGGESSRMGGRPKGLMELHGRPLIAHLVHRLPAAEALVVTRDPSRDEGQGARVVTDRVEAAGPLAGLQAALEEARTPLVALLACDMPFVLPEALELLASRLLPSHQWAAFSRDGRPEPLPGLYRTSLASLLGPLVARRAGLQELLRTAPGALVEVEALAAVDPGLLSLVGLNTPEQAARYGVTHRPREP